MRGLSALLVAGRRAGWTPLHYAAAYDSLDVIVCLLDAGADGEIRNRQGLTPMQVPGGRPWG